MILNESDVMIHGIKNVNWSLCMHSYPTVCIKIDYNCNSFSEQHRGENITKYQCSQDSEIKMQENDKH